MTSNDVLKKQAIKTIQTVCFRLGEEEFGVNILKVKEIVRLQDIAKVPQTPDAVSGVINLRGNVIPVIDLRKKLGLGEIAYDDKARIIVFFIADKLIGMIVDRVERVLRLKDEQIELPPDIGSGQIQEYVTGVAKVDSVLIILINVEKIVTEEEIVKIDDLNKIKEALIKREKQEQDIKPEQVNPAVKKIKKTTKTSISSPKKQKPKTSAGKPKKKGSEVKK